MADDIQAAGGVAGKFVGAVDDVCLVRSGDAFDCVVFGAYVDGAEDVGLVCGVDGVRDEGFARKFKCVFVG